MNMPTIGKDNINEDKNINTVQNTNSQNSTNGIVKFLKNDVTRDFLSNTAASTILAYTFFPFEGYKKHRQAERLEKFHPFRGSHVFAANFVPTSVIQLTTNKLIQKYYTGTPSTFFNFTSSIACGVAGATVATFVENCIARQQEMKSTLPVALKDMFKQSLLRPWKSFPLIAARDGIFTACMFWADGAASTLAKKYTSDSMSSNEKLGIWLSAKFAISSLGAALSHPFDTVATNMQRTHQKISSLETAKQIMQKSGVKGFYLGYPYRLVMFCSFSNLLPLLKNEVTDLVEDVSQYKANKVQALKQYANLASAFFARKDKVNPSAPVTAIKNTESNLTVLQK
jgi:hypothetical protein